MNKGSMHITPVVTVFLAKEGKVMLARRSAQVGTYRGAWAGIAGYVERLSLEQAYTELEEEAGLSKTDVVLRGIGVPVRVEDSELGRTWLVYPFLFEPLNVEKIVPDWEADELKWVEPEDLSVMPTVPGLVQVLASVWPPFGDDAFWNGLSEIATDTVHGATYLAFSGLRLLEEYFERNLNGSLTRAVRAFAACRPSMGVFPHLAAKLLIDQCSPGELARSLENAASKSAAYAAAALAPYKSILTISYSSAVKEAILRRNKVGDALRVIIMESRPELEGVTLARELAEEGLHVTVITDTQMNLFISEVDAVIVGCDAITEQDQLQNKVGTSLLVLAAHSHKVPCLAVSQTYKILPPGFPHTLEEQDPGKVGRCEGIKFRNIIFDLTPISEFDAVYTENGALTSEDLSAIRSSLGAAKL